MEVLTHCIVLLLGLGIGYYAKRRQHHETLHALATHPSETAAAVAALTAVERRMKDVLEQYARLPQCAVHQAAQATRRPDPLPATQHKPGRSEPKRRR